MRMFYSTRNILFFTLICIFLDKEEKSVYHVYFSPLILLKVKNKVWLIAIIEIESGVVRFGHDYIDIGATFSF